MPRKVEYIERKPPQRISNKQAIEKAETHVRKWGNLKKHLKKIEEIAAGVYLVSPQRKGGPLELILRDPETGKEQVLGIGLTVYMTEPNLQANQYLVDRALGKTPQRYDIETDVGGTLSIIPWLPAAEEPAYIEGEVVGSNNNHELEEVFCP